MIPLYHDFTDETVFVVGGGAVGARKALRFKTEAAVIVVSPAFDDRLLSAAVGGGESESSTGEETTHNPTTSEDTGSITLIRAAPSPASLPGWVERTDPALVVAATDDSAVNDAAEAAALAAGALINRTDVAGERDAGSVVVPATVDDGPVRVAISTGGQSPALSKVFAIHGGLEGFTKGEILRKNRGG